VSGYDVIVIGGGSPGEIVALEHRRSSGFANTDVDLQLKGFDDTHSARKAATFHRVYQNASIEILHELLNERHARDPDA
jgi:hypothetical protein